MRRRRRYLLRRPGSERKRRALPTVGLVLVVAGLVVAGVFLIRQRTSLDSGGVEVGSGRLPSSMPVGFPIPAGAAVGGTSVDRGTSTTVVELTFVGSLDPAVSSFTIGLVNAGYVVERSEGGSREWLISFSREDLRGTVDLEATGAGVRAVLTIVDP